MSLPNAELKGVVDILTRLSLDIRALEEPLGLIFGGGDFRPRIEYFHDAVRAFTAQSPADSEAGGRLCVERLAYDVKALRYLQAMPLASLTKDGKQLSPGTALVAGSGGGKSAKDRAAKQQLGELYQQYAVLFAALFKPAADTNYQDRLDEKNDLVEQLSSLMQFLDGNEQAAQNLIAHLEDPKLRAELLEMLRKGKTREAAARLKFAIKETDKDIKDLSNAHLDYASAQLALFEEGRDMVKKLAARGMNLAGRFVENAMAQASRDKSRGGR